MHTISLTYYVYLHTQMWKTSGQPGDNDGTTFYIHSHPIDTHIRSTSSSTAEERH
ncbi:hypothetical protein PA08_2512 [Cutibacterium modestum P08]|uniref:Uncharacterized protein n=1 Tax=Cutibacterium modestum TaxID=2559073 RepID=A0AAD1KLT9_9ACTN|nr:hypothetical protein PA08_2512 [Cutibacterium modestum P08]BCY24012.1 hypothetical protein KB1_00020 [Cutibacterium modestum]